MVEYMKAFSILNHSRGEYGIPLSEMLAYCALYTVPDRELFVRILRAMDAAFSKVKSSG